MVLFTCGVSGFVPSHGRICNGHGSDPSSDESASSPDEGADDASEDWQVCLIPPMKAMGPHPWSLFNLRRARPGPGPHPSPDSTRLLCQL